MTSIVNGPVALAEEDPNEGLSVHAKMSTFEKNFDLTIDQKEFCIDRLNRAVSIVCDKDMSDLEKYYRLALWLNDHATYDGQFWSGRYYMEYYRHQWDTYGVLTDKSVCAGIAITYAALCHAAGLPCKFVRLDPAKGLDHTINYIPDINGNAYYVDVTEGDFITSDDSNSFAKNVDKEFACITKDCTSHIFEYRQKNDLSDGQITDTPITDEPVDKSDPEYKKKAIEDIEKEQGESDEPEYSWYPLGIKACFETNYHDWFKTYALHQDTDEDFAEPYIEKGSGTDGVHYAQYKDYPKQFSATATPGIWFLEDFYRNPDSIEQTIRNRKFDQQLIKIGDIGSGFDCKSAKELEKSIAYSMSVEYFPSLDEKGNIVPKSEWLNFDEDFTATCDSFDTAKHKAVITLEGKGRYRGSVKVPIKLLKANPIKVSGKTATVKQSALKKSAQKIKRKDVITIKNAKGSLEYSFVNAKKGNKNYNKYFEIDYNTGNVTVAKGLKKGTYKVRAGVSAYGNKTYAGSPWKKVTFTIIVK
ncbi:MAG: hypothetical protein K5639_06410 [Eubacterium sp.]|nr:hypothetical protein [Eubacterium sp.]